MPEYQGRPGDSLQRALQSRLSPVWPDLRPSLALPSPVSDDDDQAKTAVNFALASDTFPYHNEGMRKALVVMALLVLSSLSLNAETVYFAAHGKTFHTSSHCAALARSKSVLSADDSEAIKHGLTPCSKCHHVKSTGNGAWAK